MEPNNDYGNQPAQGGGSKWGIIGGIILAVLISAGATFAYYQKVKIPELNSKIDDLEKQINPSPATANQNDNSSSSESAYKDKDFGFSFKVPAGYTLFRRGLGEGLPGAEITLGKRESSLLSETSNLLITVLKNDTRTLAKLKKDIQADIVSTSNIKVDNLPAVKRTLGGMATGFSVISTNGQYSVHFYFYPSTSSNLLDNLVSSFQFSG